MTSIFPTPGSPPDPSVTLLRDLVERQLNGRWAQFSAAHPNLAAVIDRSRLIDSTVSRLRDDPQFQAAMAQAQLDEAALAASANVLACVEKALGRLIAL